LGSNFLGKRFEEVRIAARHDGQARAHANVKPNVATGKHSDSLGCVREAEVVMT
jgi:hypothetical protein